MTYYHNLNGDDIRFREPNLDPPDPGLHCRECWDELHAPKPAMILRDILDEIGLDDDLAATYVVAAQREPWWNGFVAMLESAYEETVKDDEWSTCDRCAEGIKADAERED